MKEKDVNFVKQLLFDNGYEFIKKENINYIFRDNLGYLYHLPYKRIYSTLKIGSRFHEFYYTNKYLFYNISNLLITNNLNLFLCEEQDSTIITNGKHPKFHFYDNDGYFYYLGLDSIKSIISGFSAKLEKFYNKSPYLLRNLQNWININNKPYKILQNQIYIMESNPKLFVKCLNCRDDEIPFLTTVNDIINGGDCAICENRQIGKYNSLQYKFPDIAKEFDLLKNYPVTPDKIGAGNTTKYYWLCPNCGFSYLSKPGERTKKNGLGAGCPNCTSSLGERITWTLFKNFENVYNFRFRRQYIIKECRDINPLPFDFAIWINNEFYLLEIQGSQHYIQPKKGWFASENVFNRIQNHDQIKRDYCFNNNIKLIEIPYWNFNNIEQILTTELNLSPN